MFTYLYNCYKNYHANFALKIYRLPGIMNKQIKIQCKEIMKLNIII